MSKKVKLIITAGYAAIFLLFALTGALQSQAGESVFGTQMLAEQLELTLLEVLVAN